jgi:hypothetical protein
MPRFETCAKCRLTLPVSVLIPIIVNHQGKQMRAFICEECKKVVEKEQNNVKKSD